MRHLQFVILLTSLLFVATPGRAQSVAGKIKDLKGSKVVEFEMSQSIGEDGYPRFQTTDPRGPIGEAQMSLRCEEGYHWEEKGGKRVPYAWNYHELFVLDSDGPSNSRQDAQARGQIERGWHFQFKASDCAKAPANTVSNARCTVKAELSLKTQVNKKTGASVPAPTAKILEWSCKEVGASSSSGGPGPTRPTAP